MKGNAKLNGVIRKRKERIKEKRFILKNLGAILTEKWTNNLQKRRRAKEPVVQRPGSLRSAKSCLVAMKMKRRT